jgi:transcriptional regulator with XRE-family HTH domain
MSSSMLHLEYCNVTTLNVTNLRMQPSKEMWRKFGEFLKTERDKKGLSQEGASKIVGMTRQQWNRLENGESGTTRNTVYLISEKFNLPLETVLRLAGFTSNQVAVENIADEEFATLFYDSANWSEESRNDAIETAKDVFRRYQARERLKKANAEKTD